MNDMILVHGKRRFGEETLWKKILEVMKKSVGKAVELALTLYYCMKDRDTPAWAKAKIAAALGYFIWPVDAVPDVLPGGYADDAAVLAIAAALVAASIKKEHRKDARETVKRMFRRT